MPNIKEFYFTQINLLKFFSFFNNKLIVYIEVQNKIVKISRHLLTESVDFEFSDSKGRRRGDHEQFLPFVYEFIIERISRPSLHNIRLCIFIGQWYGRDLGSIKKFTSIIQNKTNINENTMRGIVIYLHARTTLICLVCFKKFWCAFSTLYF